MPSDHCHGGFSSTIRSMISWTNCLFNRNSATHYVLLGFMRMLSPNDPSSSTRAGVGDDAEHNQALTYGRIFSGLGVGWVRIGDSFFALRSDVNQHVDS